MRKIVKDKHQPPKFTEPKGFWQILYFSFFKLLWYDNRNEGGGKMTLTQFFEEHPKAAIAFSGGVDSAYLLYAAKKCGADIRAYYVKTPFQPQFEYDDAVKLATELGAEMKTIHLDVLQDKNVSANPANRCYYCKKRIFSAILAAAQEDLAPSQTMPPTVPMVLVMVSATCRYSSCGESFSPSR